MPRAKKEDFIDFDMLRMDKRLFEENPNRYAFDFGVYTISEIDKERDQFEAGIREKDKHFNVYRVERLTWWERLFGVKRRRRFSVDTTDHGGEVRQRAKRATVELRKKEKQAREKKGSQAEGIKEKFEKKQELLKETKNVKAQAA